MKPQRLKELKRVAAGDGGAPLKSDLAELIEAYEAAEGRVALAVEAEREACLDICGEHAQDNLGSPVVALTAELLANKIYARSYR